MVLSERTYPHTFKCSGFTRSQGRQGVCRQSLDLTCENTGCPFPDGGGVGVGGRDAREVGGLEAMENSHEP